jgi:hypothetical protein
MFYKKAAKAVFLHCWPFFLEGIVQMRRSLSATGRAAQCIDFSHTICKTRLLASYHLFSFYGQYLLWLRHQARV